MRETEAISRKKHQVGCDCRSSPPPKLVSTLPSIPYYTRVFHNMHISFKNNPLWSCSPSPSLANLPDFAGFEMASLPRPAGQGSLQNGRGRDAPPASRLNAEMSGFPICWGPFLRPSNPTCRSPCITSKFLLEYNYNSNQEGCISVSPRHKWSLSVISIINFELGNILIRRMQDCYADHTATPLSEMSTFSRTISLHKAI